ncbi:enoyl-CoA hydratase/isomerase family protein [Brackiella oedipodis]|uniref:enoyl-CoA hydratase/isomerase family protein n=1 Tax=Brackiella oedipodis TaxID=124225 RepID=UPI0006851ACB|nr:enoyl-CoA hydratase/isomerase family protein [Brackiella oedipodis]
MSGVTFSTIDCGQQLQLGLATLNRPQVLNSLSYEMAQALKQQLLSWQQDPSIVAVILTANGQKAFCAGGDLHGLYQHTEQDITQNIEFISDYFAVEYSLDELIHHYTKPILGFAPGIVMGGGLGLLMGCSHRVITPDARVAMPEVTIGLFPDVGASWFLQRVPGQGGKFLAATGAIVNADDALFAGFADYVMATEQWPQILEQLAKLPWQASHHRSANHDLVHEFLSAQQNYEQGVGPLQKHLAQINRLCAYQDFKTVYQQIATLASSEDSWLQKAASTMLKGAPLTVAVGLTLQYKARFMSLAEVFAMEHITVLNSCFSGEVREGIRALLIDKDKNPQWQYQSIDDVDADYVDRFTKEQLF